MLITNNKNDALLGSNNSAAEYLFHKSDYSQYDLGDKTLSCGRHPDALKGWLYMKKLGVRGLRDIANSALEKAFYTE